MSKTNLTTNVQHRERQKEATYDTILQDIQGTVLGSTCRSSQVYSVTWI